MEKIYRPKELLSFLKKESLFPKKSLSQNFLIDGNIVRKIVEKAQIQKDEIVLEIGPGPGVLTEELLKKTNVIAIEKDTFFAKKLQRFHQIYPNKLTIYENDILKMDFENFECKEKMKVVANLPYHITTPLLERIIAYKHRFSSLIIMVQEEVGKRLSAKKDSKDYGSLTIFLQTYANVQFLFSVSNTCFYPSPKVRSCMLQITFTDTSPSYDEAFHTFVRTAFQKRRKMLTSSLCSLYPKKMIMEALDRLGLDRSLRPENLSVEEFKQLYQKLSSAPAES